MNKFDQFMYLFGRLSQGLEMMIKCSEHLEANEDNLIYDFVAAREATKDALEELKKFINEKWLENE